MGKSSWPPDRPEDFTAVIALCNRLTRSLWPPPDEKPDALAAAALYEELGPQLWTARSLILETRSAVRGSSRADEERLLNTLRVLRTAARRVMEAADDIIDQRPPSERRWRAYRLPENRLT